MKFRIKKYDKGWVAEVQKRKWYGLKYWTHFVSVSGISSEPWYSRSYDFAEMNLIDKVIFETTINSDE